MFFKRKVFAATLIVFLSVFSLKSGAAQEEKESVPQLPVPRFVTLAADEVNLRTGPGLRYPVRWIIRKEELPVEVIREFDIWRQIKDIDGDEGWVHKSMLSGQRGAIIKGSLQTVRKEPNDGARPVVKLEPGAIVALETCEKNWCEVSAGGYKGWVKRENIWGVYPNEEFKE